MSELKFKVGQVVEFMLFDKIKTSYFKDSFYWLKVNSMTTESLYGKVIHTSTDASIHLGLEQHWYLSILSCNSSRVRIVYSLEQLLPNCKFCLCVNNDKYLEKPSSVIDFEYHICYDCKVATEQIVRY